MRADKRDRSFRVLVLLSQRLTGLDLETLQRSLEATLPDLQVLTSPSPMGRSGELARAMATSGAERLVLGLASGECSVAEVQVQARQADLDPLGVEVVNLGAQASRWQPTGAAMARAKLLLAAAVARTRAYPGSRPEHAKTALAVNLSRRALFTLSVRATRAVPAVVSSRCAAELGCRRCLGVCPHDAISLDGRAELDQSRCEGCGLCVSACPWEAIDYPGASVPEVEAQVETLLDATLADLAPRGVLFLCRETATSLESDLDRGSRYPSGWLPVAVPCTGMLSPVRWLRTLALGAEAVGVAPCGDQCSHHQDALVEERVAFCQELLGLLGAPRERVRLLPPAVDDPSAWTLPAHPEPSSDLLIPFSNNVSGRDPRAATEALLYLATAYGAPVDLTLAHAEAPFGLVDLDPTRCTGCEACTSACPTGALVSERDAAAITLSFDATACTACGLCVARCPEAARGGLSLRQEVDLRRLEAGRVAVYRDDTPTCVTCGAPIAPSAMMARIAELLGTESSALTGTIGQYCPDCRLLPVAGRRNGKT